MRDVGGSQHFRLVDVVDLECLEDLGLDEMADAAFRHHRNRHGLLNLLHHRRVGHAGNAAVAPDVGRHALERHHGDGAGVLGDLRLLSVDDVHDHAALEHLGEAALDAHRPCLGHARSVAAQANPTRIARRICDDYHYRTRLLSPSRRSGRLGG